MKNSKQEAGSTGTVQNAVCVNEHMLGRFIEASSIVKPNGSGNYQSNFNVSQHAKNFEFNSHFHDSEYSYHLQMVVERRVE